MNKNKLDSQKCLICQRIEQIKKNENPFFVMELESSYVVLGDHQFYKGYALLLSKTHCSELHLISEKNRELFLKEMTIVGNAIYDTFQPKKLNYEILGNEVPHVHCHIFPRYENDPNPEMPIWVIDKKIRKSDESVLSKAELNQMKTDLKNSIQKVLN